MNGQQIANAVEKLIDVKLAKLAKADNRTGLDETVNRTALENAKAQLADLFSRVPQEPTIKRTVEGVKAHSGNMDANQGLVQ